MDIMADRQARDADTIMSICVRSVQRKTVRESAGMCMTAIPIVDTIMWMGIVTVPVMRSESVR